MGRRKNAHQQWADAHEPCDSQNTEKELSNTYTKIYGVHINHSHIYIYKDQLAKGRR